MSYTKITDSFQGGDYSIGVMSGNGVSLERVPVTTPFAANLVPTFDPEVEDGIVTTSVFFNQAHLIDYLSNEYRDPPYFIRNMDKNYELLDDTESLFEVVVVLSEIDGSIEEVFFQRRPRIGEQGYRGEISDSQFGPNIKFPLSTCLEVYIPVCLFNGSTLKSWWLKSDIHWWGSLLSECSPFSPSVVDTSEPNATNPIYEFLIGFGTINNVLIDQTPISIPVADYSVEQYIIASANIELGTPATISLVKTIDGLTLDPILMNAVPSTIDIILGVVKSGRSCMNYSSNIKCASQLWFTEPKEEELAIGDYPFNNYYKLLVEENA